MRVDEVDEVDEVDINKENRPVVRSVFFIYEVIINKNKRLLAFLTAHFGDQENDESDAQADEQNARPYTGFKDTAYYFTTRKGGNGSDQSADIKHLLFHGA